MPGFACSARSTVPVEMSSALAMSLMPTGRRGCAPGWRESVVFTRVRSYLCRPCEEHERRGHGGYLETDSPSRCTCRARLSAFAEATADRRSLGGGLASLAERRP